MDTINREKELNLITKRARAIKEYATPYAALQGGAIERFQDITVNEAVVLGLLNQGVRKYIGVFGHGSTDLGEVLRVYEEEGLVSTWNVRNEVEASHAASAMRWQYRERVAVFTSIGPGALHAFAGSLVPLSNGLGNYYIFADETTHNEGPNMQQIPRNEQELFLKLVTAMGEGYTVTEPWSVFTALKWGYQTTANPGHEMPYYLLLPMNNQHAYLHNCNLMELPHYPEGTFSPSQPADLHNFYVAAERIRHYEKVCIKTGGGAKDVPREALEELLERSGAVYVHGPQVPGLIPGSSDINMTVGGSKGSISGNYALRECELLIIIGARGVCQWDSSGTEFKNTKEIIHINARAEDALHYNRTIPLIGDASAVVSTLNSILKEHNIHKGKVGTSPWIESCRAKRREWDRLVQDRVSCKPLHDTKRQGEILTQPAAIQTVVDFAVQKKACKLFDAGDVQANGFQIVRDERPGFTFTDTGSSYMGFAVSALLASAIAGTPRYSIAFTGDGSFMMNPQILIDAVEHRLRGMIVIFDNRRMSAISALQKAQYGKDYKTDDRISVDYCAMAESVEGVKGLFGGTSCEELYAVLEEAYAYSGLSLIHLPVYYGESEQGDLGVYGQWNVGNWCDDVQKRKHSIGL
ncbi:MAG: thiamine pyrophosphate-dependent enzyme [Spirochaetaceae bacterium]